MSVTYDSLLNSTSSTIQYVTGAPNTNLYPDSNTVAIIGPLWAPRIYGKDLTALELASSGKIAFSLNDGYVLDLTRSNYINATNFKTSFVSQSNASFEVSANEGSLKFTLDAFSNNAFLSAESNVRIQAVSAGVFASASNDFRISACNDVLGVAQNNVRLYASAGSVALHANGSNTTIRLDQATDNVSIVASNSVFATACNAFTTTANSNVVVTSAGGSVLVTAQTSNVRLSLDGAANNLVAYASNDLTMTACNSGLWVAKSNLQQSADAGSWRAYADASNMSIVLDRATDTATVYSVSNLVLSSSNDARLSATSNIAVRTVAGDLAVAVNASNMRLTMAAATNDVSMYTSNNLDVSVSNAASIRTRLSMLQSTGAGGDYLLYVNDSNMFMRMSSITNNLYLYSSNDTFVSASNSLSMTGRTDVSIAASNGSLSMSAAASNVRTTFDSVTRRIDTYASNTIATTTSNDLIGLATSNVVSHSLNGSTRVYADLSNMGLTMERATDAVTLFTTSNLTVSASNNVGIQSKSNTDVVAVAGSVRLYANASNASLVLDHTTNNASLVASNNAVTSASNDVSVRARNNVGVTADVGSISFAANASNTTLTMNAATNNVQIYASNSLSASVRSNITLSADDGSATVYSSNDAFVWSSNRVVVQSLNDAVLTSTQGSTTITANASNAYIAMASPTNTVTVYASNDLVGLTSNQLRLTSLSNARLAAVAGDLRIQANGNSNMFVQMDRAVNNTTIFTSNDLYASACNDVVVRANNDILLQSTLGSFSAIAASSNVSFVLNDVTLDAVVHASNDIAFGACNNIRGVARSNVSFAANQGTIALAANASNVTLNLDQATNDLVAYASNSVSVTASNSATLWARSNVALTASTGSLAVSAGTSNLYSTMDAVTRNFTLFASNDVSITSSNSFAQRAQSNVSEAAVFGSWSVSADQSNLLVRLDRATDDITAYASSNVWIVASNDVRLRAKSNVTVDGGAGDVKLYANASNLFLTLDRATSHATLFAISNVYAWSSNDVQIVAKSNVTLTATSGGLFASADASNITLSMNDVTNDFSAYAQNNVSLTASNDLSLTSQSNASWTALVGTMTAYASNTFSLTTSNNFVATAKSNVTLSADAGSALIAARASNMFLRMDQPTNTVTLSASNNLVLSASNDLSAQALNNLRLVALSANLDAYANSSMRFAADNSNMTLKMLVPSDLIDIYTVSNVTIRASNVVSIAATSNVTVVSSNVNISSQRDMFLYAANNMMISASNTLSLNFGTLNTTTSNDQAFTAQSNVSFFINSASNPAEPIFTVRNDQILIRGDIIVTGSVNTSNILSTTVMQESLKIQDKQLTVASFGSNFDPFDGPFDGPATNSGAGLKVDGVPVGYDSNLPEAYDKTLTWNNGTSGIAGMGTLAGLSNEAYWEFKGGSLRLTHQRLVPSGGSNIVRETNFGFRINELDELEFVKRFWYTPSNGYQTRRVARFGRIL